MVDTVKAIILPESFDHHCNKVMLDYHVDDIEAMGGEVVELRWSYHRSDFAYNEPQRRLVGEWEKVPDDRT